MSLTNLLANWRSPFAVMASIGVVAAGFLPLEAPASERVDSRRVLARAPEIVRFAPTQMEIPVLGVKAPVVPVGTEADGTMASPTGAVDVGWWSGRRPGEGNALFAAHVNWSGRLGTFYRLKDLKPGDQVIVHGEGKTVTYRVEWVRNFDPNMDATDLLGNSSGAQVATLITCGGRFDRSIGHHTERVVARAVLSA